jgi:hypothetical protein
MVRLKTSDCYPGASRVSKAHFIRQEPSKVRDDDCATLNSKGYDALGLG